MPLQYRVRSRSTRIADNDDCARRYEQGGFKCLTSGTCGLTLEMKPGQRARAMCVSASAISTYSVHARFALRVLPQLQGHAPHRRERPSSNDLAAALPTLHRL